MKYLVVLIFLFSFEAIGKSSVVELTSSILASEDPVAELEAHYKPDKVKFFQDVILKNGSLASVKCAQNHDSKSFDTVACYVSYQNLPSGVVWEFYYFLEGENWVGTNLGIISVIPSDHCVADIKFKNALGQGIDYKKVACDEPHG
jgi:hypothetical protein